MEPATIAAVGALLVSTVGIIFQGVKFVQELRERASKATDQATKSEAERDSIVVRSAEGALMVMRGMLEVAKSSNSELTERIKELEKEGREKDRRIRDLEDSNERLQRQIEELQRRMTQHEEQRGGESDGS